MSSLAEIQKQWEETHRYGDRDTRLARAKRWLPYYAFLASGARTDGDMTGLLKDVFVDRLAAENKLRPGDRVLDIGAGTGNYAIPFAAAAAEVTALDLSPESLQVLSERARTLKLSNIRTVQNSWEEFVPDQLFDLTFASMCTAISSTEELLRMEAMTKRVCAVVTVMPGSADTRRKAILSGLNVRPDGLIGDALTFYQVLYYMDRYPEVCCRTKNFTTVYTKEAFLARYRTYLPIFGIPEDVYQPYLEKFWDENAENGSMTETSELHLAMITWNVP